MTNIFLIILEQACLHIPLLCGAYITMSLLKVPDISIESAYVFGAILGSRAIATYTHTPTVLVLALALIASGIGGMCVGATSSLISRYARIPHLLSCIITFGIFHGINQLVLGGAYFSLNRFTNPLELVPSVPKHPEFIMIALVACSVIALMVWFFKTQLSYACAIFGNNPQFFEHYQISTPFIVIMGVIIGNGLAGISGYLFAQSNGFVELSIGYGKALLCLTALILGNVISFKKKSVSLLSPITGIFSYFLVQQILLLVGFNLKYFTAIQSIIVLIFITAMFRKRGALRGDQLGV